jgi:transcriptional regulator with XRE-family HTH domain
VKQLRKFQHRTQLSWKQLAELIGVSYPAVYYWSNASKLPDKESREKLRRFLERERW